MVPKAIDVKVLQDYKLKVTFENKEERIFDVKPYLEFKAFRNIRNLEIFKTVKIGGLSIKWKDGTDICPDELYNNSKLVGKRDV